jgi:hypothetical protein
LAFRLLALFDSEPNGDRTMKCIISKSSALKSLMGIGALALMLGTAHARPNHDNGNGHDDNWGKGAQKAEQKAEQKAAEEALASFGVSTT